MRRELKWGCRFIYSLNAVGALKVASDFPSRYGCGEEINGTPGADLRDEHTFSNVACLGRGDNETYADRMQSGR